MLWGINEILLLLAAIAAFLVVIEFGFRLGRNRRRQSSEAEHAHVGALQASLLGLLGLLLGFTFAMAVSRFDTRKSLVLEEANAIGTAYLRIDLLPAQQRPELKRLFREYVETRLAFYEAGVKKVRLEEANASASRLQEHIWTLASTAAAQDPDSVMAGLLIQALNEMFDLREKRQVALDNHVPETVIYLLFAVALGALGFISYGTGLTGERRHRSTAIFALLIALVLTVILDLDRPRRGLVRVSQESMLRLQASLAQSAP